MERNVTEILEDLYKLDSHFKAHDKELRELVTNLISSKPDTRFDESFAIRLRQDLIRGTSKPSPYMAYYSALKTFATNSYAEYGSYFNTKLFTGVAGALIAIILIAPLTYVLTKRSVEQAPETLVKDISSGISLKQQINNKGGNAFGKLAYVTVNANNAQVSSSSAEPQSNVAPASMGMQAMTKNTTIADSTTSAAHVNAQYIYSGDPLKLPEASGKVYKKVKGIDAGKQLATFLKNANFNVVNMEAFSKLKLQNIELAEDAPEGYSLGINFNEGTISINPNTQWSTDIKTSSSTLDNSKLISIANTFIHDHGIDVSGYGAPIVDTSTVSDPSSVPEFMAVTYPLHIDGLEVYDETGTVYGLQVIIDVRHQKASSVNNLTSQLYESSLYDLEQDSSKVIKAATGSSSEATITSKTVSLTTPHRVLMKYGSGDSSGELYIPAMLFPLKTADKSHPKNIIIPLVKDALNKISVESKSETAPDALPLPATSNEIASTTTSTTTVKITSALDETKKLLSEKLNVSFDKIITNSVDSVEWPNSCLGLPKKDESCTEMVTAGYNISLTVATSSYEYHTDKEGKNIRELRS